MLADADRETNRGFNLESANCLRSSLVEYFIGNEVVVGSIPTVGFLNAFVTQW